MRLALGLSGLRSSPYMKNPGVWIIWQHAYRGCTKPWVQCPMQYKLSVLLHLCNPSTQEQQSQKVEIIYNIANLRPAWFTSSYLKDGGRDLQICTPSDNTLGKGQAVRRGKKRHHLKVGKKSLTRVSQVIKLVPDFYFRCYKHTFLLLKQWNQCYYVTAPSNMQANGRV